jgi:hypothetical protein
MASREEEKKRRKEERLAREKAEAEAAQRKRLAQIVGGVVVAAAIVVGVILATSGGGDGPAKTGQQTNLAKIPARTITDLEDAAKAAGCTLTNPKIEGNTHVSEKVTYKTNPPTSGNHNPNPASDGDYAGVQAPAKENYVHALEHGRIEIQYKPGLPKSQRDQLEALFFESSKTDSGYDSTDGGYTLLFENNTQMPYELAATAWGHMLACPKFDQKVFDAIRAFRVRYVLKGPEFKPEPE